jgi:cation diffusion facilitator family transporter
LTTGAKDAQREKTIVALSSVGAAIGLVSFKIIVALLTGSLGILAEAAHSGLDLVASLITFLAVRIADRPADKTHNYGHTKVENISAFLEAILLLLTALWVIYEALHRLIFHEANVDISIWAFLVMFLSIGVDSVRSRVLMRVARKVGSQALEADAINFRADLWSSSIVIVGLFIVWLAQQFSLPAWLKQADAIAALGVSLLVIWSSIRLARATFDTLTDRAPDNLGSQLETALSQVEGVIEVRRIRLRRTGNKVFSDVVVAAPRTFTFEQTHSLTESIEQVVHEQVRDLIPEAEVDSVVHIEPTASNQETVTDQIHYLAELQGVHAHDIHVREVSGRLEADFDLEVQSDMDLQEAHNVATRLEQAVLQSNRLLRRVTTHLEAPDATVVRRQDVTHQYLQMAAHIKHIADKIAGSGSAHDIHIYRPSTTRSGNLNGSTEKSDQLDLVLHTIFDAHIPLSQAHIQAEEIQIALRQAFPQLGSVVIHTEPPEQ